MIKFGKLESFNLIVRRKQKYKTPTKHELRVSAFESLNFELQYRTQRCRSS